MTLRIPAKVLLHVWSYDFYDMTLSTGKQRRHMIKNLMMKTYLSFFNLSIPKISDVTADNNCLLRFC